MSAKTEKEQYNHYRTNHVQQMETRQLRLAIVKLHDLNRIDSKLRDLLLKDPLELYNHPKFARFAVRSIANDLVHCDLHNKNEFGKASVEPYTKLHNYQKTSIYLKSKSWVELREKVITDANYTCSDCNFEYGNDYQLVAHHVDESYPNLFAEDPDELSCKCKLCHDKSHGFYWMYKMPKRDDRVVHK